MSKYAFCPTGQMEGILTTNHELTNFANIVGSQFLDEYIPLPNLEATQQIDMIRRCNCDQKEHFDDVGYWERDNGKHGWCCNKCGKVIQWG